MKNKEKVMEEIYKVCKWKTGLGKYDSSTLNISLKQAISFAIDKTAQKIFAELDEFLKKNKGQIFMTSFVKLEYIKLRKKWCE